MTTTSVPARLGELSPAGLDEVNAAAALQARVDRKYVVPASQLEALLDRIAGTARVLEIDARRQFAYESVYFDTPELTAYHLAARRRRNRFKVRTRAYLDTGTCSLEVKLRDPLGVTHKHRCGHPLGARGALGATGTAFLAEFDAIAPVAGELRPTLVTNYSRTTLLLGATRATLDFGVTCRRPGATGLSAGFDRAVIVETKCPRGTGPLDRLLWELHVRPATVSKYGTGLAALHPGLPCNKWQRTLARHVELH
jgi:hypothetical protein